MKNHFMKGAFLLILILATAATDSAGGPQTAWYGFEPARPMSLPPFTTSIRHPYLTEERSIHFLLQIDAKGIVKKVRSVEAADSLFAAYASDYLKSAAFLPASFESKATAASLIVDAGFHPGGKIPDFRFPVDSTGAAVDRNLLVMTLQSNEMMPPKVLFFPSFYADIAVTDTSYLNHLIILRLALSSSGEVNDVTELYSDYTSFTPQLKSAALFGKYTPAKLKGKAISSEALLVISFFPVVNYPTKARTFECSDSLGLLERLQVQLQPFELAPAVDAVPRSLPLEVRTRKGISNSFQEPFTVEVRIDTMGGASAVRFSKADKQVIDSFRRYVKRLRFHPARDFTGKQVPFEGLIRFEPIDNANIRIRYLWLTSSLESNTP